VGVAGDHLDETGSSSDAALWSLIRGVGLCRKSELRPWAMKPRRVVPLEAVVVLSLVLLATRTECSRSPPKRGRAVRGLNSFQTDLTPNVSNASSR